MPFNRKVDGRYRYYREPSIMASPHAERYEATLDHLFETYSALIDPLIAWLQERTPRDADDIGAGLQQRDTCQGV